MLNRPPSFSQTSTSMKKYQRLFQLCLKYQTFVNDKGSVRYTHLYIKAVYEFEVQRDRCAYYRDLPDFIVLPNRDDPIGQKLKPCSLTFCE